jgi:hypothetical protein
MLASLPQRGVGALAARRAVCMRASSVFAPSGSSPPTPRSRQAAVAGAALAVVLGVGVYATSRRAASTVPTEVVEALEKGHASVRSGAPLSAVQHYERAKALLTATQADPVQVADVLTWLGGAQEAGKQVGRATASFAAASTLLEKVAGAASPSVVDARGLNRRRAILLSRLADLSTDPADAAGKRAQAVFFLEAHLTGTGLLGRAAKAAEAVGGVGMALASGPLHPADALRAASPTGATLFKKNEQEELLQLAALLLQEGEGEGERTGEGEGTGAALSSRMKMARAVLLLTAAKMGALQDGLRLAAGTPGAAAAEAAAKAGEPLGSAGAAGGISSVPVARALLPLAMKAGGGGDSRAAESLMDELSTVEEMLMACEAERPL